MDLTIKIKEGLGEIKFGMPVEEIVNLLGMADEVENIDNAVDESTTVLRYNDLGLTLFCEGENPALACVDVANEDCTLFGEQVFDLDERSLVNLMVKNNITEQDVDEEDWGERRVTFNEGNIDFYYDNGEMVSIIMGACGQCSARLICRRLLGWQRCCNMLDKRGLRRCHNLC